LFNNENEPVPTFSWCPNFTSNGVLRDLRVSVVKMAFGSFITTEALRTQRLLQDNLKLGHYPLSSSAPLACCWERKDDRGTVLGGDHATASCSAVERNYLDG